MSLKCIHLIPHFFGSKNGAFRGLKFSFSIQNKDSGYSFEPPCRSGSYITRNQYFWAKILKISNFFNCKILIFSGLKISTYYMSVFFEIKVCMKFLHKFYVGVLQSINLSDTQWMPLRWDDLNL